MIFTIVGEHLRILRERKGLSQEQLANMTGVPRPKISKIENGKANITLSTLETIMVALEVAPGDFFNLDLLAGKSDIKDKRMLLEVHNSILRDRDLDEVEYIVRTTQDFLNTVDSKKK